MLLRSINKRLKNIILFSIVSFLYFVNNILASQYINNSLVLNQDKYNTCAVFATTTALNIIYHRQNNPTNPSNTNTTNINISQQCLLALGNYLYNINNNIHSGWNGALIDEIILRIEEHGVVNTSDCPDEYPNPIKNIPTSNYQALALISADKNNPNLNFSFNLKFKWEFIFNKYTPELQSKSDSVINALETNNLVLLNFLIISGWPYGMPFDYKTPSGLFTIPVNYDYYDYKRERYNSTAHSHAAVIIDYNKQRKLFKLINSWGKNHGEYGFSYMTAEYLNHFADYAIAITNSS